MASFSLFDSTRGQEEGKSIKQKQEKQKQETETGLFGRTQVHTRIGHLPIIPSFVFLLLLFSFVFPAMTAAQSEDFRRLNQTFRPGEESKKMRLIRTHLSKINKPAVKSIQSPDGDILDCVMVHQQPAFDHPLLKGTKPLDPPERPNGHHRAGMESENFQLWTLSGETCPEGTIPIRRTTEEDILRAKSIQRFGRKTVKPVGREAFINNGHEHAVATVSGEQYYGAKALISVWDPQVTGQNEFSLTQLWVLGGSYDQDGDLNTLEAGWQVSQEMYGDNNPRFFTYWTTDAYETTGCYNLLCSGFVQTSNEVAIGAVVSPPSVYDGRQFELSAMIWKDPKNGDWWLEFGGTGILVGYWPAALFTHLRDHADFVHFGGEVVNTQPDGYHTTTQMGSGHFSYEGYQKAAYVRNMQFVDYDNNLTPLSSMVFLAEKPNCYDVRGGINDDWGSYIFFGGPGRNPQCP